ncbi:hypothetical protein BC834DRAFT_971889 [Gloeopeniophorella convolvens]|nr:hypothetical protein BC834DRAFT_971889 [Gloeopeniophorella convolvens]
MSSNQDETNTVKSFTVHSEPVQTESSIGDKVGQGVYGALNVIHGIGDSIRGLAIDIADFGHGSGKTIESDGRAQLKEGVRQLEGSVHR